jgi:hypothetical protein
MAKMTPEVGRDEVPQWVKDIQAKAIPPESADEVYGNEDNQTEVPF